MKSWVSCLFLCFLMSSGLLLAENHLMQIDPEKRAQDYLEAFQMLRKEKTSNKILIHLTDDSVLQNIIEMHVVGNGTLLHFKLNTPQGIKLQVVEVEKILYIEHL